MTPVVGLSDRLIGRDPDDTVNDRLSPLIVGVIENDSFLVRTYDD